MVTRYGKTTNRREKSAGLLEMIKRPKAKSGFRRNVVTLMTGTTIAQALPIAVAPILTRIYSPEEFGLFAFYFAIFSILAVSATGRYELAIVLPKKDGHAVQILWLSWIVATIISILIALAIWLFEGQIIEFLENPKLHDLIYFIPLSVFLTGIYQSLYYWFNREKDYKTMAKSRIFQSGMMVFSQVLLGWVTKLGSTGLVLGQVIGQFFSALIMLRKFSLTHKNVYSVNIKKMLIMASRYKKFPKIMVPAHLMNVTSLQSPNLMFNLFFTSATAGFYLLIQRVLSAPASLIGSAIGDVFRMEAMNNIHSTGDCSHLFRKVFMKLTVIGFFPFAVVFIFSVEIFTLVFGEDWKVAGDYAQILIPMFYLQFISSPLSTMYIIKEKQGSYFFAQLFQVVCVVASFIIANNSMDAIFYISITFSLVYLYMIYFSYKLSKKVGSKSQN